MCALCKEGACNECSLKESVVSKNYYPGSTETSSIKNVLVMNVTTNFSIYMTLRSLEKFGSRK